MCDPELGNVYVREKGHLRRVSDIVLVDETKPVSSSCRRTDPLVLRKEHFIFTYNAEGSLRYSAKSLYEISLLFIADNIHHVDSLIGFPEQVGARLFTAAEEKHVFLNPDTAPRALQLFSDAYGEMVLGSLCLRNRFPLLSERMDEIKTFHSLKSLDLFGCRLGDHHEVFQHLTSDSLASLVQLFIGGNNLSDVGLQRFTTPIRMLKKGLNNLQLLDLSYNPISERALGYLQCLPKLQKLDISGTGLKLCTSLKTALWNMKGLVHSEKALDIFDHSDCKTEGWAEQIVKQWETTAAQMPKQKKIEESRTSAIRFFGRQRFIRDVLDATPLLREKMEDGEREKLHFCKPAANSPTAETKLFGTTAPHTESPCCHNVKKRQRASENRAGRRPSPPAKRFSSSAPLTAEDMDLLNGY